MNILSRFQRRKAWIQPETVKQIAFLYKLEQVSLCCSFLDVFQGLLFQLTQLLFSLPLAMDFFAKGFFESRLELVVF